MSSASHHGNFGSVDELIAYVESIELAEPNFPSPLSLEKSGSTEVSLPPSHKKEGYVAGGGITAFTEKVSGQAKQDILNATLFAQLAASKKYDRESDTENWYKYYVYVLSKIGFVLQEFRFKEYTAKGSSFTMESAVLDILGVIIFQDWFAVLTETLSAMKSMAGSDRRIQLFGSHSSNSSKGNFQIYPCTQSPNGDVSLALGTFYFTASEHRKDYLFFHYESSKVHMYQGAQSAVLNEEVYGQVRSTIAKKLGRKAIDFVSKIDI